MSEQDPNYSKNPIIDGLQHLGHWAHVAAYDTLETGIKVVKDGVVVAADFKDQFPTLAAETSQVATDVLQCKTLMVAIAAAASMEGVNLAADAGVLAALITDGPTLIKLCSDAGKLVQTVGSDIQADAAAIK